MSESSEDFSNPFEKRRSSSEPDSPSESFENRRSSRKSKRSESPSKSPVEERGDLESKFNTDHTRTIFQAVKDKVPSWCIVIDMVDGIKVVHNIRQEIIDRIAEDREDRIAELTTNTTNKDKIRRIRRNVESLTKSNVIRAFNSAHDIYARYHTFYADIEESTTEKRRVTIHTRGGRNPINFFWLVISCILGNVNIKFNKEQIQNDLNTIALAISEYDMSLFDDPFQSTSQTALANYNEWLDAYQRVMKRNRKEDEELRERIEFMEQQYNSTSVPDLGNYEQYNSRFRLKPILINNEEEYEVQPSDGMYIYEMSRTTRYIPLIHYRDINNDDHYKAKQYSMMDVSGSTTHRDIAYPKHAKIPKPNYIIFTLWLGDPFEEGMPIAESPVNTLVSVAYKLNHGTMTIRMDQSQGKRVTSVEVVEQRIAEAFPNLVFKGTFIPVGYRGTFDLFGVKIRESLLIDQFLNDIFFQQYFYLEDRTRPFYQSGTIIIRHISGEVSRQRLAEEVGVKIDIIPLSLLSESRLQVSQVRAGEDRMVDIAYPPGTSYLHIAINKGIKAATYDHIVLVLRTLMAYHSRSRTDYDAYPWAISDIKYPTRRGNLEFSSVNYPDILPSDYSTLCAHRPILAESGEPVPYRVEFIDQKSRRKKIRKGKFLPVRLSSSTIMEEVSSTSSSLR